MKMKFKRALSVMMALVMMIAVLAVMPTKVDAATTEYTGTVDEWGTVNFTLDLTTLADTDVIYIDAFHAGTAEWPTVVVQLSDANTNWGNDCYIQCSANAGTTESEPQRLTVSVADLKAKYNEVVGSDWTSSTALRIGFWNEASCKETIYVDSSYVAPTTDAWVDNGDGSYSYTATEGGSGTSNLESPFPSADASVLSISFKVTVEGYANGCLGANMPDWVQTTWELSGGSKTVTVDTSAGYKGGAQFQIWWINGGSTVTVSDISVVKADQTYKQISDDNSAVRFVQLISEEKAAEASEVTFTISNGSSTVTRTSTSCYDSISVAGSELTAPEGYVFVAYAITGVPSEAVAAALTCTISIE